MKWTTLSEKTLFKTPVLDFVERDLQPENGDQEHRYYLLKSKDWCNIIPVTEDGKIVLVRQHRVGIDAMTLENPGGMLDEGEDGRQAALREMTEETGYEPLPNSRCVDLGWCHPNPALLNNRCHTYVVGPVKKSRDQNLDAGEAIETLEVPLEEIPSMILDQRITHALTLNTLLYLCLGDARGREGLLTQLRSFASADPTQAEV